MKDLTTGSITRHLLRTSGSMLIQMVFQTLYFLIDLYWVGRLGTEAVAGVGIAGNLTFVVLALTQTLGVGTTVLISHAVGRKDQAQANRMFNQSQLLTVLVAAAFLVVGLALTRWYARTMSADARTAELAYSYLVWFVPAMGLQFGFVAMASALRATGSFRPGTLVATVTLVINIALAPVLIFGWGTGRAFGVAGAAIATLVAIVVGNLWLVTWFLPRGAYLRFHLEQWKPDLGAWKKMLAVGLPAGFEFAMTATYLVAVYTLARPFGAAAQAGFGIGMRIFQAGFMPVVALAFSVAPVAGQNFGARQGDRVRQTFRDAAALVVVAMLLFVALSQALPAAMIGLFTTDPAAVAVGEQYLRLVSLSFVPAGIVFVGSSMFQAMGNTIPSLITSAARVLLTVVPAVVLSTQPGFGLHWIWYLAVGAAYVQLAVALLILHREFSRRLRFEAAVV